MGGDGQPEPDAKAKEGVRIEIHDVIGHTHVVPHGLGEVSLHHSQRHGHRVARFIDARGEGTLKGRDKLRGVGHLRKGTPRLLVKVRGGLRDDVGSLRPHIETDHAI